MNQHWKEHARKWGAGIMAAGLLLSGGLLPADTGHAAASKNQSKADQSLVVLKSNGKITQQTGIFQGGQVWVPVSFMRDVLGMPVAYDKAEKTYSIGTGTKQTKLMVSEFGVSISVNNYFIKEYEGRNFNNKFYVPVGLLSDYLGYQGDWSAASSRLNIMKRPQNALTVTTETYAKDSEAASIKLKYPKISGLSNAAVEQSINNTLKQMIMNFAAGAEHDLANRSQQDHPYEYDANYIVSYNQNGVLSLVTEQYAYTGGAHGITLRQAYTFSLKDGKTLLLGDLFGANPSYKKQLNAKLTKLLKADGGYLGGFTGLNTEKYFYLKEGKVVLFFQLYEYTAYAAGFPEYTFSFKELLPDGSSPFATLK
jgi:hypothetical protein